ncbi:hypothetical protein LAZ67_15001654 [Cordylochernes scorpioides]|uniref:Transposase n=1 Tax=Cordylochernes scorpioides TaxID=51811 RepID=A0ABY6LCF9_9ARAC|nr:hypothetical protein LAZ67_15001654 [Cordylochernes scorpioides]
MTTRGHIRPSLYNSYLAKHGIALLPQPPYSPDLAHDDFFLYPKIKKALKGHRFDSLPEIKKNTNDILKSLKDKDFQRCFDIWKKRWSKCIDSDATGDVEEVPEAGDGEEVPGAGGDGEKVPGAGDDGEEVLGAGDDGEEVPATGGEGEEVPGAGGDGEEGPATGGDGDEFLGAGGDGEEVSEYVDADFHISEFYRSSYDKTRETTKRS